VYNRLKGDTDIDEELTQQFEDMENEIQNAGSEPVIEIEEVEEPASIETALPEVTNSSTND
jgi:hypothetical protein